MKIHLTVFFSCKNVFKLNRTNEDEHRSFYFVKYHISLRILSIWFAVKRLCQEKYFYKLFSKL